MSEKKGFLGGLFGKKQSSCCNMEIIEESENSCCGDDLSIDINQGSDTSNNDGNDSK